MFSGPALNSFAPLWEPLALFGTPLNTFWATGIFGHGLGPIWRLLGSRVGTPRAPVGSLGNALGPSWDTLVIAASPFASRRPWSTAPAHKIRPCRSAYTGPGGPTGLVQMVSSTTVQGPRSIRAADHKIPQIMNSLKWR